MALPSALRFHMVKIRLRRIGTKGRPFYRVVVAPSTAGRNGRFVETLGTYNPVIKPVHLDLNKERAMHWLMEGAQPTETAARLLNKVGVLEEFFAKRPEAKKGYTFLDKRTASISKESALTAPVVEQEAPAKAEKKKEDAPVAEATPAAEEAPAVEEAPAETPAETE